jgi:hypothetical protein
MARKFKVKPGLFLAYLPGCGRIQRDKIIEGDHYARYLDTHLVEILDAPVTPVPSEEISFVESIESSVEVIEEPVFSIMPVFNGAEMLSVDEHIALSKAMGSEPGLVLQNKKGRPKK